MQYHATITSPPCGFLFCAVMRGFLRVFCFFRFGLGDLVQTGTAHDGLEGSDRGRAGGGGIELKEHINLKLARLFARDFCFINIK